MTPDDAQGDPESQKSAETPASEATTSQTAEGTHEVEAEFSPDELPEEKRAKLLKWVDKAKAEYHRQEVTKAGNSLIKVPPKSKDRLRANPNALDELEAENAALKRVLVSGGNVGQANGVSVTKEEPKPNVDTSEQDAKEFLEELGWAPDDENYKAMLRNKTLEFRFMKKKGFVNRPSAPPPDIDKVVEEKLTAKEQARVGAEAERHWAEIKASPEYNHPQKGFEFRGRLMAKLEEARESGTLGSSTMKEVAESVRAEMYPAATPRAKVSMGEGSSGKVAASAGSDPWAAVREACKANGEDPSDWVPQPKKK